MKITQFDIQKAITFTKLFNRVKLSPTARLVLRCLVDHWNTEKMFCYPSQETISEEIGASIRSVKTAIQELRKENLILSELKNSLNYTFTAKFFELINIAPEQGRKCTLPRAEIAPKQIKEKEIKKPFFKNSFEAKPVPPEETKKLLEKQENDKKLSVPPTLDFFKSKDDVKSKFTGHRKPVFESFDTKMVNCS